MTSKMTSKIASHRFPTRTPQLLLFILFVATWVSAQRPGPSEIEDALNRVKQGEFFLVDVGVIARAHLVQAIPILKEQFAKTQDPHFKDALASALVTLGDKEDAYWDFLAARANEAVESDIPFPRDFDSHGKIEKNHFSQAFLQWAKNHGLSPGDAGQIAGFELPGKVLMLAVTGDPRGLPLLRKALSSPNYLIQSVGAKGLARLQDKESIPLIIDACERAPADMAASIAEALIFFDDPQAKSASEKYIPKDTLASLHGVKHEPANNPF
jgi:hypothetical protein